MALKISETVRNAMLDAIEATVSTSAILKLRTGDPPAAITDADSGTVVSTISLPEDWMAAASGGTKALSGTWTDGTADNAGTVGHFRLYASNGTTQHMQGSVTATGGGGDLTLDNNVVAAGQSITISSFTLTADN